jgi:hypothetical protein
MGLLRDMPTASWRPVDGASSGSNEENPEGKKLGKHHRMNLINLTTY